MKRQKFLRTLRELLPKYGSENIVYFDETGFAHCTTREHGWAKRGKKIFGDVAGNHHGRTNLVMAQRGKEWLAPMLFEGSCTAKTIDTWVQKCLLKELTQPSVIIMEGLPHLGTTRPFITRKLSEKCFEKKDTFFCHSHRTRQTSILSSKPSEF